MALRFDAAVEALTRTTTLPTMTAFTMMGWFKIVVGTVKVHTFMCHGAATGDSIVMLGTLAADGVTLAAYCSSGLQTSGSVLTVGTWYHLALVRSGTGAGQLLAYVNGVQNINASNSATPATAAKIWVGNDAFSAGAEFLNGAAAAVKIYSAVLTANEIAQEMMYYLPIRGANLNTWCPCIHPVVASNNVDFSGVGGNMVISGTLAVEDGPPIAWAPRATWKAPSAPAAAGILYTQLEGATGRGMYRGMAGKVA